MDLFLINQNKLKVILTAEDMSSYDLTCETIDYDTTETKRAFWDILDTAKHRTGFDAASDRVYIQVYPCRGGGCEMYVTKLRAKHPAKAEREEKLCRVHLEDSADESAMFGYSFDSMHSLLCACRVLQAMGGVRESSAYSDKKRQYLLFLGSNPYPVISEFGREQNAQTLSWYVSEHGSAICVHNAVETLSSFL